MLRPLTPLDCDLRDFPRMMIDIPRLFGSDFDAESTDAEWRYGVTLWLRSFHEVPAASIPRDDKKLMRLCGLGRDGKSWAKAKAGALRGWIECDDGRLYHPVVAEVALEAWLGKLVQRLNSGAGNAKRWEVTFDPKPIRAEIAASAALLRKLNPKAKALTKRAVAECEGRSVPKGPEVDPQGNPQGMPGDIPEGSQEKGKGKGKGISLPEGAQSAVSDPNGEAWQAAVALLTSAGKVRETAARSLFGKLLKDHGLEARDLHPSILSARLNGTLDPQAYLTRAAQAVAARKGTGKQAAPTSAQWDDDSWATAIRLFREGGEWDAACGPTPDENGCRAPAHLLSAANVVPLEAARRA